MVGGSLLQEYLAAAVAFDIDFRKNFNKTLRDRFGPPIVNISNLDPRLRVKVQIGTSNSEPNVGMNTALDWFLGNGDFSQVAVILGGFHSAVTAPISSNAAVFGVPHIGWGATSPALSDKVLHPYFVRTCPPDSLQGRGMWVWMNHFQVPAVAFFYTRDSYGEGLFSTVIDQATAANQVYRIKAVPALYQPKEYDLQVARDACQGIRDTGSKVVFMAMTNAEGNAAMYQMEDEGMLDTYQLVASESIGYMPSAIYKPADGLPVGFVRFLPVTRGDLYPGFSDVKESLG